MRDKRGERVDEATSTLIHTNLNADEGEMAPSAASPMAPAPRPTFMLSALWRLAYGQYIRQSTFLSGESDPWTH